MIYSIFDTLRWFLEGKKTYILATLFILEGLINKDMNRVLEGLTIMSGRAAISKM